MPEAPSLWPKLLFTEPTHSGEAALWARFDDFCSRHGIMNRPEACFAYIRQFEDKNQQMTLEL